MSLKRKIYLRMKNVPAISKLTKIAVNFNLLVFHFPERRRVLHPGNEDRNITYYIIRPRGETEGLLSSYYHVMHQMYYAECNKYIPYVDFKSDSCQYFVDYQVNGTYNAWEYFFQQPNHFDKIYLSRKRNVILQGWTFHKSDFSDREIPKAWKRFFIDSLCPVQPYIQNLVQEKYDLLFPSRNGVLGVFVRGTDYVALHPKGHPVQPSVEQIMDRIDLFKQKYRIEKIYVVTEDFDIFSKIKNKYGESVFSADDNFVFDYEKSDYVATAFHNDAFERGRDYLIRLLLLTRCDYLISSIASGSNFARDYKQDEYIDSYIFDLGLYD